MKIREGLRRPGIGADGQDLADGRFCWRCRRTMRAEDRAADREQRAKDRQRVAERR